MSSMPAVEELNYRPSSPESPVSAVVQAKRPPRRARLVILGLTLLAAASASASYVHGRGRESTDDAQIEGRIVEVAARSSARVTRVLVEDNQLVNAGDVLVELEHDDLDARVAEARAELSAERAATASAEATARLTEALTRARAEGARVGLEQAGLSVTSRSADSQRAAAGVVSAEARFKLAQREWERSTTLVASDALSKSELDHRDSALAEAEAALEQARLGVLAGDTGVAASRAGVRVARAQLEEASADRTRVEVARAAIVLGQARAERAEAALRLAELNRSYATIRAPVRGVVSQRTAELGKLVSPERPLLTLVSADDAWVVAAFKEDQIGRMRPGQAAEVVVDAYPGQRLNAHVGSIAGASGARFAVLPPDNASGNFVKVVQRIPVLLRFDGTQGLKLRPGMSVAVTVSTGTH